MGKFTLSYYVSLRSEFPDEISITISALKGCSVRTLPQVSCRREHVLFTLFVFCVYWCQTHVFAYIGVKHMFLFLFVLCTLCCHCLWIVLLLPLRCSLTCVVFATHKPQENMFENVVPCWGSFIFRMPV